MSNLIIRRKVTNSSVLPSAYIPLDYIESTGAQYINTGMSAYNGAALEARVYPTAIVANMILSSYHTASSTNYIWRAYFENNTTQFKYSISNGGTATLTGTFPINTWYVVTGVIRSGAQRFSVAPDNSSKYTQTTSLTGTTMSNKPLFMFAQNANGTVNTYAKMRMSYLKYFNASGVLVKHFVACKRRSDNVAGMFDLVTMTFYASNTATAFVAGNVIPRR